MNAKAKTSLKEDKVCRWGIKIVFLLSLFPLLLLLFVFSRLPPQVPLFYSRPWGEEQLAPVLFLWFLPGGAALLSLFNFGLAGILLRENPFLARLLVSGSVLISLLGGIAVVRIITLVL